jgi:hypothetical protein
MAARLTAYLVACIVAVTFIAGLIVGAQRDDDGPVDLIIVNGKVFTGEDSSAQAVAVQGNKVLRVGSNREIQRLARAQTTVIDAQAAASLPASTTHVHLLSGGLSLDQVSLGDATTLEGVRETVKAWAEANPSHAWVRGRGWLYGAFPGGLPTRQILDQLVPDRPAYLVSYDGHTGWANSAALEAAGVTRRTPNLANGSIVKEPARSRRASWKQRTLIARPPLYHAPRSLASGRTGRVIGDMRRPERVARPTMWSYAALRRAGN